MPKDNTNQQLQLHYVHALRTVKDGWTPAQKTQLMDWYAKAITWRGGASFPGFINLLFDASLQTFTPEEKKLAYEKVPQFAPLTEAGARRGRAARGAAARGPAESGQLARARRARDQQGRARRGADLHAAAPAAVRAAGARGLREGLFVVPSLRRDRQRHRSGSHHAQQPLPEEGHRRIRSSGRRR